MPTVHFALFFFFYTTATTEIYTLSLHDALPISATSRQNTKDQVYAQNEMLAYQQKESTARVDKQASQDRKSGSAGMPRPISYAVFCLKKKTTLRHPERADASKANAEALLPAAHS